MTPEKQNKDLHFKGQYADEHVEAFFRSHWITLMPHIFVNLFFLAIIAILFVNFYSTLLTFVSTPPGEIVFVLSMLILTYSIHLFFIKFVNHFLYTVIITNFRIVEIQNIIFIKDLQVSLDMSMIQDVEKKQNGIFKNILNFGELIVVMSSSDIRVIKFVPNPNFQFRLINRLKLEWKQKRTELKDHTRQHQPILFENLTFSEHRKENQTL